MTLDSSSTVLVVGATGRQGGSVVRALQQLPSPPMIRALSRNLDSPSAIKLKQQGVEVIKGSLADQASLEAALRNVDSAFLVYAQPGKGSTDLPEDEQGRLFLAAARAVSLPFLVYSSASDVTQTCGVSYWEAKARFEEILAASGQKHAVLAPVAFMDNFPKTASFASFAAMGLFDAALHGKALQMIAVDDIGYFAAQALTNPATFAGRKVQLAGDSLSMEDVRRAYQRVEGRSVWKAWFPSFVVDLLPKDMRTMLKICATTGTTADVEVCRREHAGLKTFEQWLRDGRKSE
ncbi:hypothetical protein JCM8097_002754 [Rhodosporidiobolus ruineniae]